MWTAAPGVHRHSETTLNDAGTRVAALVPLLFPADHFRALVDLVTIDVRTRCEVCVLLEEVDRVHANLSCDILQRAHR